MIFQAPGPLGDEGQAAPQSQRPTTKRKELFASPLFNNIERLSNNHLPKPPDYPAKKNEKGS